MKNNNVDVRFWCGIPIVRISDKPEEFKKWLYGQTLPMVEEDKNPYDWAYYYDWYRWVGHLPVID